MIKKFEKNNEIISNGISVTKRDFRANSAISIHRHDFIELEYILEGHGTNVIDGREYELKKNTLFFTLPTDFHEYTFDEDTALINITLSESFCDCKIFYFLSAAGIDNAISIKDSDLTFVNALVFELFSAVKNNNTEYYTLLLNTLIIKATQFSRKKTSVSGGYAQDAMMYIMSNFRTDITLKTTAEYIGITPAYLSAVFYKETGIHFKDYLNSMRYDYAKKLLKHTKMSISEISYECGFCDFSNFLRGYKARFGISPGNDRKNSNPQ